MKIKSVDVIPLQIPFEDGSPGVGLMPTKWTKLDIALVRIETEDGLVGWGDGFAYSCRRATVAAIEDMVAPLLIGREINDLAALNLELQQRLHLHGRYGITIFAISAVDIALWDLKAKTEGVSLAKLLADKPKTSLPAYASLVRYGEPDLVRSFSAKVVDEGYSTVKLHEIALEAIEAGRDGAGAATKISTDVNCNWSLEFARKIMPEMKRLDLYWVEEPVFPPDDAEVLGALQTEYGVPIASGENACTSVEFARTAPAIHYLQPSVTKVGGVTEFLKVCDLAERHGAKIMPHAPYFGPGYWATLQLMAARGICEQFEHLYVTPDAYLDPSIPLPEKGVVAVPDRPGIGFEPNPSTLDRYRI
ncbi:mandelate racemase/muconate lactonizing enzyme family protein [Nisaea sediminum]|uniref:mandelate racemase/muconate lactonizing enzyme family protein n=1 Tax=Nisaea sediminum TaxID=2775867 RepID=UPI001865B12F|nr:mandelate racemase/muconate lactonizing enzyme family protein [Nisaea sediminum]